MTELIIGRDSGNSTLRVASSDGTFLKQIGTPGSVPHSVSRTHVSLTLNDDGTIVVKNLNESNVTTVKGLPVARKQISKNELVELGPDRYTLNVAGIVALLPREADMRPLAAVWREYNKRKKKIQQAQGRFSALRSGTGVITMMAVAMSFIVGRSPLYLTLYGLAIAITLCFTIAAYVKAGSVPKQNEELDEWFKQRYRCPSCGRFMGYQAYDILSQNPACPYCKAKYIK